MEILEAGFAKPDYAEEEKKTLFRKLRKPSEQIAAASYSWKPGGLSPVTAKSLSSATPTRPTKPSSKRRPRSVMPCGTRRGGSNFGRGFAGSGAQSLRASETSTNPARSVSDGWPVKFVMVSC